jgi:hypothetical protein
MERGMCSGVNNIAGHFTIPFPSAVVVVFVVASRRYDLRNVPTHMCAGDNVIIILWNQNQIRIRIRHIYLQLAFPCELGQFCSLAYPVTEAPFSQNIASQTQIGTCSP